MTDPDLDVLARAAYAGGVDPVTLAELRLEALLDVTADLTAGPYAEAIIGGLTHAATARRALAALLDSGWTPPATHGTAPPDPTHGTVPQPPQDGRQ
jgi:hypothetical protein